MRTIRVASPLPISRHYFESKYILTLLALLSCGPARIEKQKIDVRQELFPRKEELNLPQIIQLFKNRYVDSFTYQPEQDTSIEAICGRVDPFTYYLSPRENEFLISEIEGKTRIDFGFKVAIENDTPIVSWINSRSQCRKSGLCIGDRLLSFNDLGLLRKSQFFIDSLLEHYPNRGATLKIFRPAYGSEIGLGLLMSSISGGSDCCAFMLSERIGYLWFGSFSEGISKQIEDSIKNLQQKNPHFTHLIIDLRSNHGGFTKEALALLSLFCQSNKLMVTFRSVAHPVWDKAEYTESNTLFGSLRLIVLVDDRTWSAAEILSGALQDLDRATIVGQQTGGKGLAMHNISLPDGSAIMMCTSRYYLPSGRCLQIPYKNGIMEERLPSPQALLSNPKHKYEASYSCSDKAFYTLSNRPVYGEMGIVPDFFVPDNSEAFHKKLTRIQRYQLYRIFVDRYQTVIFNSYCYEAFVQAFPLSEGIKRLEHDIAKMQVAKLSHSELTGALNRMMEWVQEDYFGQGTQTTQTLMSDNYIQEAKRLVAVDIKPDTKVLAAKSKLPHKSVKKIKFAQK